MWLPRSNVSGAPVADALCNDDNSVHRDYGVSSITVENDNFESIDTELKS